MSTKQKVFISVGVVLATLIFIACISICAWWYIVCWMGPDIEISNTTNIGLQESEDGTQKPLIEVKSFKNTNGTGKKALEIKFNSFTDETQTLFTSQGFQFVARDSAALTWTIELNKKYPDIDGLVSSNRFHLYGNAFSLYGDLKPNSHFYNYSSLDDFAKPSGSANPLNEKSHFKIQIGEDLFMMKFKGIDFEFKDFDPYMLVIYNSSMAEFLGWMGFGFDNYALFPALNEQFIAQTIYNLVEPMAAGTNSINYFEFGDYFDYYRFEDGKYVDITPAETEKVKVNVRSYFAIKIEVVADGLNKASQSMFKAVLGSPNYNANGDFSSDDYFTGKTILTCTNNNFDFVKVTDGYYAAKLKDEFTKYYNEYKSQIVLSINIDLDQLAEKNINFVGMTNDWNTAGFTVKDAYTTKVVNGEIIKEVIEC